MANNLRAPVLVIQEPADQDPTLVVAVCTHCGTNLVLTGEIEQQFEAPVPEEARAKGGQRKLAFAKTQPFVRDDSGDVDFGKTYPSAKEAIRKLAFAKTVRLSAEDHSGTP